MQLPVIDLPISAARAASGCATCYYWISGIGCCRQGSPHFRTAEPVEECATYRPEPDTTRGITKAWNATVQRYVQPADAE